MATILKYGAPFPFGIAITNPIYSIDPYAGPYENEADALAVFPAALREVGRAIGIYTDATKRAVRVYNWEKNVSDAWVLVPQAGEYELTSSKLIAALGYTPMSTTHAANGVTTTLIGNWNTAFTNNHTHSNKAVLDATTASYTTADKAKLDSLVNYELTSAKVVSALGYTPMATTHAANGVTTTLIGNWNTAFTNNHTHSNKAVLDGITQAKINAWDAKPAGITGAKLRYVLMNPDGSFNVGVPSVGNLNRVLGLDEDSQPKISEVENMKEISMSNVEPSVQELNLYSVDRVDYPLFNSIYFRCGNTWIKIVGQEIL